MDAGQAIARADVEAHDTRAEWRDNARIRTLCPFPACAGYTGPEHRSLSIDTATGLYKCHRCKAAGKLRDYWEERPATSPARRKQAAALRAVTAPPPAAPVVNPDKAPPPEAQAKYAAAFPDSPAETYLEGRGIPAGVAQAHGCGFAVWKEWQPGDDGRLECVGEYPRATFPVRTLDGALVAIQGRAVGECPASVPSKKTRGELKPGVFNPDALRTAAPIITEAPIDALSLAVCGYPAVALMGTTVRPWLSSAFPLGCTVYLGTDADDAGDKAAGELNRVIRLSRCERLRPPEPWKDWNAALCGLGRDALAAWLGERIPPVAPTVTPTAQPASPPRLLYVQTRTLGETVRVVEAAARIPIPADGEPVTYTRAELERLDGQPPDVLRTAHLLKRAFGGFYIGQAEDETPPPAETGAGRPKDNCAKLAACCQ